MNDSRSRGILRLKHLREVTEAKGEEMAEQRERFQRLAREDSAPRVVSSHNLFQTPPELAARLVALASDGRGLGRILEPSAGLGRIYNAVRAVDRAAPVVLVDVSPECAGELYRATEGDGAAELVVADFLTIGTDRLGRFDTVVMNPPFRMGTDIKHIRRAAGLLRLGGRLVSLCAAGPKQRRAFDGAAGVRWIDLPAGTFKSEGTGVESAIVVIDS